jgi:hypothetical protein
VVISHELTPKGDNTMNDEAIVVSTVGIRQSANMKHGTPKSDGSGVRKSGLLSLIDSEGVSITITYFEGQYETLKAEVAPLIGKKRKDCEPLGIPVRKSMGVDLEGKIVEEFFYNPDTSEEINADF